MENYHLGGNHSKRNTINTENFCKTLKNKGFAEGENSTPSVLRGFSSILQIC